MTRTALDLFRQFCGVCIVANGNGAAMRVAHDDRGAGKDRIAHTFFYVVGFTRQHRFIHENLARKNGKVGRGLIAGGNGNNVVQNDLAGVNADRFSVADHPCFGFGNDP